MGIIGTEIGSRAGDEKPARVVLEVRQTRVVKERIVIVVNGCVRPWDTAGRWLIIAKATTRARTNKERAGKQQKEIYDILPYGGG